MTGQTRVHAAANESAEPPCLHKEVREQLTMLVFLQLNLVVVHQHMRFTGGEFFQLLARCRVLFVTCETGYIHGGT